MEAMDTTPKNDFVPGRLFKFDTPKMDMPKNENFSSFLSPLKRFSIDFGACFSPKANEIDNDLVSGIQPGSPYREYYMDSPLPTPTSKASKFDFTFAEPLKPNLDFTSHIGQDTTDEPCDFTFTAASKVDISFSANFEKKHRLSLGGQYTPKRRKSTDRHLLHKKRRLSYFRRFSLNNGKAKELRGNSPHHVERQSQLESRQRNREPIPEDFISGRSCTPLHSKKLEADQDTVGRRFNSNRNKVRILSSPSSDNGKFLYFLSSFWENSTLVFIFQGCATCVQFNWQGSFKRWVGNVEIL